MSIIEYDYNSNKNKGVIVMKFFATLLITWSHMAVMFPDQWKFLITGGAIGDGLFFFCSGFTLFLGRNDDFIDWYKRRINRIYPTIIMWALLSSVVWNWDWKVTEIITTPKYWFVPCIMVYYVFIYLIRQFLIKHLKATFAVVFIGVSVSSLFILDMERSMMYAQLSFMIVYYFLFMLLGSIVAVQNIEQSNALSSGLKCLGCLVLYYICMALYLVDSWWCQFQMVSIIPLLFSIYYAYLWCNSDFFARLMKNRIIGCTIFALSSITLEVYLVQNVLLSGEYNNIWPLNVLVVYLLIFALAYTLKCLSNIFSQIFSDEPFKWERVYKLR